MYTDVSIRLPLELLLKTYKNQCLVESYLENVAFWFPKRAITIDEDFFEFTIKLDKQYNVSYLQSLNGITQHRQMIYDGKEVLTLFDNNLALYTKNKEKRSDN